MANKIIFTEEQEKEIIEFYLTPKSLNETTKHFGFINTSVIKKVLKKYNIPFHNSSVYRKIQVEKSKKTNIKKYGVEFPAQYKEFKEKAEQTCLQKYGVKNGGGSQQAIEKIKNAYWAKTDIEKENIKNKRKTTTLEKYDVENVWQSDIIQEKIKQTNLERYGFSSYSKIAEYKTRFQQTNLERYGVDYLIKNKLIKEKARNTCQEKYGGIGVASEFLKEKIKTTNLEKYGVENPFQAEEIKEKIKDTMLKKYGVPSYTQTEKYRNNLFEKYGAYHAPTNRYKYKNQYFDSFPELCLYMYCLENNISIIREPIELVFEFEGKSYHYYPDFKINNELVEIKGDHFLSESGA